MMIDLPNDILFEIFKYSRLDDVLYNIITVNRDIYFHCLQEDSQQFVLFTSRYTVEYVNECVRRLPATIFTNEIRFLSACVIRAKLLSKTLQTRCFELLYTSPMFQVPHNGFEIDWVFRNSSIRIGNSYATPIFYLVEQQAQPRELKVISLLHDARDIRVKGLLFDIARYRSTQIGLHILVYHREVMSDELNPSIINLDFEEMSSDQITKWQIAHPFVRNLISPLTQPSDTLDEMQYHQFLYRKTFRSHAIVKGTTGDKLMLQIPNLTANEYFPITCSGSTPDFTYARAGDVIDVQGYFNYNSLSLMRIELIKPKYRGVFHQRELLPFIVVLAFQLISAYNYGEWLSNWAFVIKIIEWQTINCLYSALILLFALLLTMFVIARNLYAGMAAICLLMGLVTQLFCVRCIIFYAEAIIFSLQVWGVAYSVTCLLYTIRYNILKRKHDRLWLKKSNEVHLE